MSTLRLSTEIPRDFVLIDGLRRFDELCKYTAETERLSFDYETSSVINERYLHIAENKRPLDLPRSTITSCSFRVSNGKTYYLSVDHLNSFNMPKEAVKDVLLLKPKQAPICAHNMGFEWLITKKELGLDLRDTGPLRDTMVAAKLLDSNQAVGLKDLTRRVLHILQESYKTVTDGLAMNQLTAQQVLHYGCDDSYYQWELENIFDKKLKDLGLWTYYTELEMPLVPIIAENTLDGVYVDESLLAEKTERHLHRMSELATEIYEILNREVTLSSPVQMAKVLYTDLNLPMPPYAESQTATDKESLYWNIELHPVVAKFLEWKKFETRYKLYDKPYPNLIHPDTGMMHTQIRQAVTDTGRYSQSSANLQQLAKRGDGVEVRELFPAPKHLGYDYIIGGDMSQAELVIAAHRSRDENLLAQYGKIRGDVHTLTTCGLFDVTPEIAKTNKVYRQAGKTANFSLLYGGAAKRIYRLIKLELAKMGLPCPFTLRDAEQIVVRWFRLYPGVRQMQKDDVAFAKANGYVTSLFGRRFYLPDIYDSKSYIRSKAERKATNSPIQGTCAELMKRAMIKIYNERVPKEDLRLFASIHDELDFYVSAKAVKDVAPMIQRHLGNTPNGMRAYMASDLSIGTDFGSMMDINKFAAKEGLQIEWD